jgi:hypothetical protein
MSHASIAMRILYGHLKVNTFGMASAGIVRFGASAGDGISGLSHEHENDPNITHASPAIAPKSTMPAWGGLYQPCCHFLPLRSAASCEAADLLRIH